MTPEERQAAIEKCFARFAIIGYLKNGKPDACICVDDLAFKKEMEKFGDVVRTYKLVEIHKR